MAVAPSPPCCFDVGPVRDGPSFEICERLVEGSTDIGQLVKGGSVDPAGINVTDDQSVTFGFAEGIGKNFVRHAFEGFIKLLIASTTTP